MAGILPGDGAEHVQMSGPHAQIFRQAGGGHLGTLFPSVSVAAILFGTVSCELTLFLEHETQI